MLCNSRNGISPRRHIDPWVKCLAAGWLGSVTNGAVRRFFDAKLLAEAFGFKTKPTLPDYY